jgi:YbbR domain-containing protein
MIAFLRQLFFKDFWLKLFSLSLAVLTWITVTFAIQKEGSPTVPLTGTIVKQFFYNQPVLIVSSTGDANGVKVDPGEVEITVEGDPQIIHDLQSKDIRAIVDVSDIKPAVGLRRPVIVSTPPNVTYLEVQPQDVTIIFPTKEREHAVVGQSGHSL